jgi:hypothetical protein
MTTTFYSRPSGCMTLVSFWDIAQSISSNFPAGITSHTPSSEAGNSWNVGVSLPKNWREWLKQILNHQPKDNPTTPEGILLRDADILEQLGAVGVLRAAAKVGRDTRYPTFSSILPVLNHAVNHLANQARLTQTKVMAQSRVEMLRSFLAAIKYEVGDLLY